MKKKLRIRDEFKIFKLTDIEKLCLIVLVVKPKYEQDLKIRISELGGRVLLSRAAQGISRRPFLEMLGIESKNFVAMFAFSRSEDAKEIVETIGDEFDFKTPGKGKIFACPVDGYLGAKGPLVEV